MTDDELNEAISILKRAGSIDYAKDMAMNFSKIARENLKELEESKAREMLEKIAIFAVEREK